jgi:hypothetical protein
LLLPRPITAKLNDSALLVSMNETLSMTEIADVLQVDSTNDRIEVLINSWSHSKVSPQPKLSVTGKTT